MIVGRFGASRSDVVRLFEGGSVAGLGDGELLERFVVSRDEAAFEALVARLGPMVLGVCRRMLADPHDVDDAFQATFLVLVRRAGSIRDRDLVGPWLHGVASRVARRARGESTRRSSRERVAVVVEALDETPGSEPEWPELRAMIDEEIERLPEHHRRAVILCDVEGLTREEAAVRLGWSLNMVRGRLERARDRLRGRLTRRGVAPSGGYLALLVNSPNLPPLLLATTCRAALSFGVGRMGVGLASASAVVLSEGVLQMMMLSKLKLGLVVVLSTGFLAGTGMLAAKGQSEKQDSAKPAAVPAPVAQKPARADDPFQPRSAADLAKARIDEARHRLEIQQAFYEEGRITMDRLVSASNGLMQAELDANTAKADRVAIIRAHHARLAEIVKEEEAELEAGRATEADVSEAKSSLLDAEFLLAKELEAPEPKPAAKAGSRPPVAPASNALSQLAAERVEIARGLFKKAERLYPAEIDVVAYLKASQTLLEAEEKAATTREARIEAIQRQLEVLNKAARATEALIKQGIKTSSDLDQIKFAIIDAKIHLIEISEAPQRNGQAKAR